jgi:hypothetical protein
MARKPSISHDLVEYARTAVRIADGADEIRKAQAILLPAVFSLDLVATGIAIGRSKASVCRLQAQLRADCSGSPVAPKRRGGRRRQNMSLEQESQFLAPFFQKAREGKLLVVAEIRKAYETLMGKSVPASTVYRMLARHGWSPPSANRSTDSD